MVSLSEHTVTYGANNSKSIFYYATGPLSGPLIIFLHGWPALAKTWLPQLNAFSALGFRCVAPDMPGYGRSTVTKNTEDYSQEAIVEGLVALLADTGRDQAVWIGHDWGSATVWSFAAHHPDKCIAVAGLTVPYRTVEAGVDEAIKYANRAVYPVDKYPDAQWSYIRHYMQDFEKAVKFQDDNVASFTKIVFSKTTNFKPETPAFTSTVLQDGGWFSGVDQLPPADQIPDPLLSPELLTEVTSAMEKGGYFAPGAYYYNNDNNKAYNALENVKPTLEFPVLFIEARFDDVAETVVSRLADPMRRYCKNLTEASIASGHWVQIEKPTETNAAIARWLATEVATFWPGAWRNTSLK